MRKEKSTGSCHDGMWETTQYMLNGFINSDLLEDKANKAKSLGVALISFFILLRQSLTMHLWLVCSGTHYRNQEWHQT